MIFLRDSSLVQPILLKLNKLNKIKNTKINIYEININTFIIIT